MTTATAQHKDYRAPKRSRIDRAETPYVRARREWDQRLGSSVVQAKNWRFSSLVLVMLLGGSLAGNIYLGRQPKMVPHIIEIDRLGEVSYRGAAGASADAFVPSEALVRQQLRRFIDLTRTVSSDTVVLRKNWVAVYKMLSIAGSTRMTEWVCDNNPFERATRETTGVEIVSAVAVSSESWQIDWQETAWDRFGQALGKPVVWRAMLRVIRQPPETREQMIDNPLGLFIDEFHWDRVQAVGKDEP